MPQLEFLSRLFQRSGPSFIQAWVDAEPSGQYARRAAFFYECDGGQAERFTASGRGYVDAIDSSRLVAATAAHATNQPRWRVRDNLPGTRHFCPTVVRTDALERASALDVRALLDELTAEFGEDLLLRAATWMTLRESKASFAIEGEGDRSSRIQRFADVMARQTGQGAVPLTASLIASLQQDILGERSTITEYGLRQSPVFVGEIIRYQEIVHYVAPPAADIALMLEGLQRFLERTQGESAVLRSAVAAFGFVYIHPLADGNGRIHRFLINDVLRRDGVVPDPVILPVSAVITDDTGDRRAYDKGAGPRVEAIDGGCQGPCALRADPYHLRRWRGVQLPVRRGPACQALVALSGPGAACGVSFRHSAPDIDRQMREESRYLRGHALARAALKEVVEMPDPQADRLLRSIEQNKGALSNVLAKEMPVLREPDVWEDLVGAVQKVYQQLEQIDTDITRRYRP